MKILDKSGAVLRYFDADTLSGSDLSGSDLSYADLSYADLRGANLSGANLIGANLNGSDLIIITWSHWETYITPGHIRIGCQSHGLESWKNFNDEQISEMDSKAIDFWKQNKELIIGLCERFEVKNTGDENE